jgi:signal transduction histidine kinase
MMNWRRELRLEGEAETGIDLSGRNSFAEADSQFCGAILAMAGHDLRQPLQVITSAHDVLAQLLDSDKQREELARAANATARLASMLGQLVEALQLRERSGDLLHVPVRLRPILEDLAAEFAEPARLKWIEFRVVPADTTVFSHSVLLKVLVRNLIRNAIDYTPPGGRVLVGCRRHGSEVHLQVRDSGVGIPGDELGKVFRPFHRLDTTRPEGLGLGLFIVKHTADCLRHDVQVYSVVGRGSGFAVVTSIAPAAVTITAT